MTIKVKRMTPDMMPDFWPVISTGAGVGDDVSVAITMMGTEVEVAGR